MNLNENEFLLAERVVPKNQEKKLRPVLNFVEEICQVRSVFCKIVFVALLRRVTSIFSSSNDSIAASLPRRSTNSESARRGEPKRDVFFALIEPIVSALRQSDIRSGERTILSIR